MNKPSASRFVKRQHLLFFSSAELLYMTNKKLKLKIGFSLLFSGSLAMAQEKGRELGWCSFSTGRKKMGLDRNILHVLWIGKSPTKLSSLRDYLCNRMFNM